MVSRRTSWRAPSTTRCTRGLGGGSSGTAACCPAFQRSPSRSGAWPGAQRQGECRSQPRSLVYCGQSPTTARPWLAWLVGQRLRRMLLCQYSWPIMPARSGTQNKSWRFAGDLGGERDNRGRANAGNHMTNRGHPLIPRRCEAGLWTRRRADVRRALMHHTDETLLHVRG